MAATTRPANTTASVWLLGLAQRRLDRRPGKLGRALARSAYGAFMLQGVVLIGLMIALRPARASGRASVDRLGRSALEHGPADTLYIFDASAEEPNVVGRALSGASHQCGPTLSATQACED